MPQAVAGKALGTQAKTATEPEAGVEPEPEPEAESENEGLAAFFREHIVDLPRLARPLRIVVVAALVQIIAAALLIAEQAIGFPAGVLVPLAALVAGAACLAGALLAPNWPGFVVGRVMRNLPSQGAAAAEVVRWRPRMPARLPFPVPMVVRTAARVICLAGAVVLVVTALPVLFGSAPQDSLTLDPGTTVLNVALLAAALSLLFAESLVLTGATFAHWPMRLLLVSACSATLGALAVPSVLTAPASPSPVLHIAVGAQIAVLALIWVMSCWVLPLLERRRGGASGSANGDTASPATRPIPPVLRWAYILLCLGIYFAVYMVASAVNEGSLHAAIVVASLQTLLGLAALSFLVLPLLFLAGTDFAEMGIVAAHSAVHLFDRLATRIHAAGARAWPPIILLALTLLAALHAVTVVAGYLLLQSGLTLVLDCLLGLLVIALLVGGLLGLGALVRGQGYRLAQTLPYWVLFVTSVTFELYTLFGKVSLGDLSRSFPLVMLVALVSLAAGVGLLVFGRRPRIRAVIGASGPASGSFLVAWSVLLPLLLWAAHAAAGNVSTADDPGAIDYHAVVLAVSTLQVVVGLAVIALLLLPLPPRARVSDGAAAQGETDRADGGASGLVGRVLRDKPILPFFVLQASLQVLAWMAWLYFGAEGASDTVAWARALVLGAALLWDALMCGGQITAPPGRRFPRRARVPVYYGLLIGLSTMVFYFASWRIGPEAAAEGLDFRFYLNTEHFPMIGLALFGIPLLVIGCIAALLARGPSLAVEAALPLAAEAERESLPSPSPAPTAPPAPPRVALRPRVWLAVGLGALALAVVLGGGAGLVALGRAAPPLPAASLRLGLDAGYDAHGQPVVIDPRASFGGGDSLGYVLSAAPGHTFKTSTLDLIVDARAPSGAPGARVSAGAIGVRPEWTAHAYRMDNIDVIMGGCSGSRFMLVVLDGTAILAKAPFTYTGCGQPPAPLHGHVVFGAAYHTGADGMTFFVDQPATTFRPGDALAVVVVMSATFPSQTLSLAVLQDAGSGSSSQPQLIYFTTSTVPNLDQATEVAQRFAPIQQLLANCHSSGSDHYVLVVGDGSTLLAEGSFVYTGCGTTSTQSGTADAQR